MREEETHTMSAPMPAAPMVFREDGAVAWGEMWDSFCVLAQEGGPPHRPVILCAPNEPNVSSPAYQEAAVEICRGIFEVSRLEAAPAIPGWIAVQCHSADQAHWLADAIIEENVEARAQGSELFVPVGEQFTLKGEIKSVITAVAKTSHYWKAHLPPEVKQTLVLQRVLAMWSERIQIWFRTLRPGTR